MHYHALSYQYMQDKAFAAILETIFLARFDLNQKNAFFWKKFWLPENLPGTPRLNRTRHRREDREARTWPPAGLSPRVRRRRIACRARRGGAGSGHSTTSRRNAAMRAMRPRPGARWVTDESSGAIRPSVKEKGRQKRHPHLM
jgi:hypothetical protein